MAYQKQLGADHPGLFVFLLDQSGSMLAPWPGDNGSRPKATLVADIVNRTIKEISARCLKGERVSRRCDLILIGYGDGATRTLWSGNLSGHDIVPIPDVADNPLRVHDMEQSIDDGAGGILKVKVKLPIWVEPAGSNGTPMEEALSLAYQLVEKWIADGHAKSFPPLVFNITDGVPNNPASAKHEADRLRTLKTDDGSVLLASIHIPDHFATMIAYPTSLTDLPSKDASAHLLFDLASTLPAELLSIALESQLPVSKDCKLMLANADAVSVIQFLNFGTLGTLGKIAELAPHTDSQGSSS